MSVTDVIRPVSVRVTGGGTAVPSGTLATVTADNSDATYIDANAGGLPWNLRCQSHTPPANHQRHRMRARHRLRTNAGTCTEIIYLGRGTSDYIHQQTVAVTTSFAEQATSWFQTTALGLAVSGALADLNIGGGSLGSAAGGANEIRTAECYIDIDCRARPDYSPEVRDAAGVDQTGGLISDTDQPTMFFGAAAYDGLPPLDWSVTVKLNGVTEVWSDSGSGIPPTSSMVTTGLDDGSYTAEFSVRSTIRVTDPFEHLEILPFDVGNVVPPPSPPLVSVEPEFGGYRVNWTNPGGQEWDNGYVVAEVWREDCTGNQRIATVPDGLNGSYLDLAIPQLDPQPVQGEDGCETVSDVCDITYSARYWGYVSVSVELPDTIPDDLILGWPSTVATIPSGWSRVTALDGFYPRGSSGTGAPSVTGGSSSHAHSTPSHIHVIGAHTHDLGGSTGSSNSSTTSARFNGASQAQADQPHTHVRQANTGNSAAANSGSASPGTNVENNTPATRDVIWIQSDGAQTSYPIGVLGWATESVSGWESDASSSGRFLKGAAAAGNGGASTGAATHSHTVELHIHSGINHIHPIGGTGLSNPASSTEAGSGSSEPRWLPRHGHPMTVSSSNSGSLSSSNGGTTGQAGLDPPNRRLRVLRNTGGGIQTRIIGLYTGTVAALDPLMTLCNGSNGTPDMRTWFARDVGSDSVNSTGGAETHTHSVPTHTHEIGTHVHDTTVGVSTSTSFEAPTSGSLGDSPTTGHTHSSGNTDPATPSRTNNGEGTTGSAGNVPVYKEVHFVRLDGTIAGDPLPIPELKVSDFATVTVPSLTYDDGLDRLSSLTDRMAVVTDRASSFPRLVADSIPLDGGLHSVSVTSAGEDLTLTIATVGKPEIDRLEELLSSNRVYWSPVGGTPGWFAPAGWTVSGPVHTVKVAQVTMIRQPWPDTPEPQEFL